MKHPAISVVITVHAEKLEWITRAIASVERQIGAPEFEIIVVADAATSDVKDHARSLCEAAGHTYLETTFADLGSARNAGIQIATGKYIAILDGDDMLGYLWLKQAHHLAESIGGDNFMIHPEYNVFFGAQAFFHRHISDNDPEFDARDQVQFNAWSALAFAPKAVFERFPYFKAENGFKYEDFVLNTRTLGAGVTHRIAPGSAHMIRLKLDNSSMAMRYVQANGVIPKMDLYDRRDLPNATKEPVASQNLSESVFKQVLFAHRELGEQQLLLNPSMTIRQYPRARCWDDQAFLRDSIGSAKHVVLVNDLVRGGAEKYGIDWAAALVAAGESVALVATTPDTMAWAAKAASKGVRVVEWKRQVADLSKEEELYALQRGLIQCELKSLFVCNSTLGWGLLHANAQTLAEKVFAANFATIPQGMGFETCPAFWLKDIPPNLTIVTDNEAQAKKLRDYNGAPVVVIRPKCEYEGPSKRSQIEKKSIRVLWAGRGSPEKNAEILPAVADALGDKADIHVWGDVKPMNGPENLKYRGPFDGFASIDGSYDCYLLTSITEGMPNTAMEAVMAGLPVVGPNVGGLPEIASAIVPLDPKAIAEAVLAEHKKDNDAAGDGARVSVEAWAHEFNHTVSDLVVGAPKWDDSAVTTQAPSYVGTIQL